MPLPEGFAPVPVREAPHEEGPFHAVLVLAAGTALESMSDHGWLELRLATALDGDDSLDAALVASDYQVAPLHSIVAWHSDEPAALVTAVDSFLARLASPDWDELVAAAPRVEAAAPAGHLALSELLGTQSLGLLGMPRLALRALDPARLELTRDWFTSRGARLVCDFEVSDGWQPALPDLEIPAPRDVDPVVGPLPGHLPAGEVAALALVPRTRHSPSWQPCSAAPCSESCARKPVWPTRPRPPTGPSTPGRARSCSRPTRWVRTPSS